MPPATKIHSIQRDVCGVGSGDGRACTANARVDEAKVGRREPLRTRASRIQTTASPCVPRERSEVQPNSPVRSFVVYYAERGEERRFRSRRVSILAISESRTTRHAVIHLSTLAPRCPRGFRFRTLESRPARSRTTLRQNVFDAERDNRYINSRSRTATPESRGGGHPATLMGRFVTAGRVTGPLPRAVGALYSGFFARLSATFS